MTLDSTDPLLTGRLTLICDLPDPTPADAIYQIEAADTLANGAWTTLASKSGENPWTWLPGGTARIVETSAAGRTTVKIGDSGLQSAYLRRFIRLNVTRP